MPDIRLLRGVSNCILEPGISGPRAVGSGDGDGVRFAARRKDASRLDHCFAEKCAELISKAKGILTKRDFPDPSEPQMSVKPFFGKVMVTS